MMIHSSHVEAYPGTSQDLAEEIGNLRYDALAEFLRHLTEKMARDAQADRGRNRPKLAGELDACAQALVQAAIHAERAWTICAPRMPTANDISA